MTGAGTVGRAVIGRRGVGPRLCLVSCCATAALAACAAGPLVVPHEFEAGGMIGDVPFSESVPGIGIRPGDGIAFDPEDPGGALAAADAWCRATGADLRWLSDPRLSLAYHQDGIWYLPGRCG